MFKAIFNDFKTRPWFRHFAVYKNKRFYQDPRIWGNRLRVWPRRLFTTINHFRCSGNEGTRETSVAVFRWSMERTLLETEWNLIFYVHLWKTSIRCDDGIHPLFPLCRSLAADRSIRNYFRPEAYSRRADRVFPRPRITREKRNILQNAVVTFMYKINNLMTGISLFWVHRKTKKKKKIKVLRSEKLFGLSLS